MGRGSGRGRGPPVLEKILIANRGEIAVRIIRTARRLGVATVAVVSEADRGAPFAAHGRRGGGDRPGAGDARAICAATRSSPQPSRPAREGIHPGYGFLAENADFAEAVGQAGIKFIGPSPDAMRRMGGKADAKAIAAAGRRAGGAGLCRRQPGRRRRSPREAKRVGYPVMIKAVAGGGGRGMRLVEREADFAAALESAQREAQGGVRRCPRAAGEGGRQPAPHRGAGVRRRATATSCICSSATARCSGATRR